MPHLPNADRYALLPYRRTGRSGLKLPALSLGMWKNFGFENTFESMREMTLTAFDLGITHLDLANTYGRRPAPPRSSWGAT